MKFILILALLSCAGCDGNPTQPTPETTPAENSAAKLESFMATHTAYHWELSDERDGFFCADAFIPPFHSDSDDYYIECEPSPLAAVNLLITDIAEKKPSYYQTQVKPHETIKIVQGGAKW